MILQTNLCNILQLQTISVCVMTLVLRNSAGPLTAFLPPLPRRAFRAALAVIGRVELGQDCLKLKHWNWHRPFLLEPVCIGASVYPKTRAVGGQVPCKTGGRGPPETSKQLQEQPQILQPSMSCAVLHTKGTASTTPEGPRHVPSPVRT